MMNGSKRFKLYKSGKKWLIAAISATTMMTFGGMVAHAATDASSTAQTEVASAATSSSISSTTLDNTDSATSASSAQTAATPATVASTATVQAAVTATEETSTATSAASSASDGSITTTSEDTQQAALSQVNAVRSSAASSDSAISAVALNDDLNAWAQTRANEMAANNGQLDSTTQYSSAPTWVSSDGVTSTDLQQSPNYEEGDAVYGSELTSSMQYWYTSVQTGEFLGYFAGDPTDFTTLSVNNWTNSINYDAYKYQYLTMTSPYANVVGYAYAYNATTGYTAVVLEVAYLPDITETETKTVTRTINYLSKNTSETVTGPITQTVTYTRIKSTSQVDGTVTYSDWTSTDPTFAAVESPDLSAQGYTTGDPATVAAASTTAETPSETVTVYYDDAETTATETKTVTRTINYLDQATNAVVSPAKVQTVTYTRAATTDAVTGDTTYTDWASADTTFAAIDSPDLSAAGYTAASETTVAALSTTADLANQTVDVYYNAAQETATETETITRTVNYLDQTTNAVVSPAKVQTVTYTRTATTDAVTGNTTYTDWTSTEPTFAAIESPDLSADGYAVASEPTVAAALTTAESTDIDVNVFYDHAVTVMPESKTITRTINYLDRVTGTVVSPARQQEATYTRTATTDQVTGAITYTNWTSTNATFAAVVSPDLSADGYTPASEATIAAQSVAVDDADSAVNVYYDHAVTVTPETETVTRTINYLDRATGTVVSPAKVQTVTFNRTATTDQVTGTTTDTDWITTDATFAAIESPDLSADGYAPASEATIAAQTVAADDADSTVNVYYDHAVTVTPETETVTRTINYLDRATGAVVSPAKVQTVTFNRTATTDRVTDVTTYTDWTGTDTTFAAVTSPDLSADGYTTASDVITLAQTVTAGEPDTTLTVYYGHATTTTTESKTITRTIKYVDAATGTEISDPNVQTVTFTRNATLDNATKTTTYTDWTSDHAGFDVTTSPEITGYTTNTATTPAQAVTIDMPNSTVIVDYDATVPDTDNNSLPESTAPVASAAAEPESTAVSTQPVVQPVATPAAQSTAVSEPVIAEVAPEIQVAPAAVAKPAAKAATTKLPQTDNAKDGELVSLGVVTLMSLFGLAGVLKRWQTK